MVNATGCLSCKVDTSSCICWRLDTWLATVPTISRGNWAPGLTVLPIKSTLLPFSGELTGYNRILARFTSLFIQNRLPYHGRVFFYFPCTMPTRCLQRSSWRRQENARWWNHNRTEHFTSCRNIIVETDKQGIRVISRNRRILFTGFVKRMQDTRLPKCVLFRGLTETAVSPRGHEKERMGCFL